MRNDKQKLAQTVNYLSQEQAAFINSLIGIGQNLSKGSIMDIAYDSAERGKIDSAMPVDYVRRIQDILPTFNTWSHAYSYNNPNSYGAMVNVCEDLMLKFQKVMSAPNFDQETVKLAPTISGDLPFNYKAYTLLFTLKNFGYGAIKARAEYYLSDAPADEKLPAMRTEGSFMAACLKGDFCEAYKQASEGNREVLRYGLQEGTIEL